MQVHEQRDHEHQRRSQQVRPDQHLPARPAVEEHPGERADEREREQQHGERLRDLSGRRLFLGGEDHIGGERDLERPVGELPDDPCGEQQAEGA